MYPGKRIYSALELAELREQISDEFDDHTLDDDNKLDAEYIYGVLDVLQWLGGDKPEADDVAATNWRLAALIEGGRL